MGICDDKACRRVTRDGHGVARDRHFRHGVNDLLAVFVFVQVCKGAGPVVEGSEDQLFVRHSAIGQ